MWQIPEPDETFVVQLGSLTGGAAQGIPVSATIVILENDMPVTFTGVWLDEFLRAFIEIIFYNVLNFKA